MKKLIKRSTDLLLGYWHFKYNPLGELQKRHVVSNLDANRKIAVILVADVVEYRKHMERDEKATL